MKVFDFIFFVPFDLLSFIKERSYFIIERNGFNGAINHWYINGHSLAYNGCITYILQTANDDFISFLVGGRFL